MFDVAHACSLAQPALLFKKGVTTMALFRRDNSKEKVPTELEQYYDRPLWQVWLRRILVVIIVAVLVLGVFMLARAVYRSVTDNGDSGGTGQTTQQAQDENNDKNTEANRSQSQEEKEKAAAAEREKQQQAENAANQDQAMPRTGDDPTDQPAPAETLPATGG